MKLILASQSPRRAALLQELGLEFTVRVADIDETMTPGADPATEVARVSRLKAEAVPRQPEETVIAADTIVVCDGHILGKPASVDHARQMLRMLSGRGHQVMTGLTVISPKGTRSLTEITHVYFYPLTDTQIDAYIATGEPMDKAGSYGIQGGAGAFCQRLEGDYHNVVGLPLERLKELLAALA
jgi:septum formation protein